MLGVMDNKDNKMTLNFKNEGDILYMIGHSKNDISSSEYLYSYLGIKASPTPHFDLDFEYKVQKGVKGLIEGKLVQSVHDISEGGLFVTLAESAMAGKKGFEITSDKMLRKDAFLFGEAQSRVVVSVDPSKNEAFVNFLSKAGIPSIKLGKVKGDKMVVDGEVFFSVNEGAEVYDNALHAHLG
jgi:phosphoribosylformylglycinamidine synthase